MSKIVSFREKATKVKVGVAIAWVINFAILVLSMEAAILLLFMPTDADNGAVMSMILKSLPIAVVIAAISMTLISFFSWKAVSASASRDMIEVTDGTIYNVVNEMVTASGGSHKDMPKVYIAQDVAEPNAFALSSAFGSQIVFTQGLIDILSRSELQAVAAHEWGHIVAGDSKSMTKLVAMTSVIATLSTLFRFTGVGQRGGNRNPLAMAVLVLSVVFLLVAPLLSAVSSAFMSRQREKQADILAVQFTRDPGALARALKKISAQPVPQDEKFADAVAQLAFFNGGKKLMSTHPTMEDRLGYLEEMGSEVGKNHD